MPSYPEIMKTAKVTTILRKGVRNNLKNFCSNYILCSLNKIFDSLITSRVKSFHDENTLLTSNQYRFRKKKKH